MGPQTDESFYRLLADRCLDLVIVLDGDGVVRYASPSIHAMLGYRPEELVGERGLPFLAEDEAARISEFLIRIAGMEGCSDKLDFRARHADGSYRFLEAFCAWIPWGGSSRGVMIDARDETERRRAQEVLGMITMIFLSLGVDPLNNIRRLLWAGKETLGTDLSLYCRSHRGRLHVFSTSHEDDGMELPMVPRGLIAHDLIAGLAKGPVVIGDLEGTGFGRSDIFASKYAFRACAAHPVTLGERTVGCMYAFYREAREFTEQELAVMEMGAKAMSIEEERFAHQESLKDLTDIVSHELRHPITILSGYAGFLEESWHSLDEAKRREILGIISSSVDRLDNLVNELLDVSRIEKGLFSINEQDGVELDPLLEQAVRETRGKGAENEFVLCMNDGHGIVRADPEKLKQVLIILLENAVKYSPKHSTIEIRVDVEEGRPVISVLDRGPGIRTEDRMRIFEPFFQSEEARNHSRSGIGLGLYIAKEIVEAHGGRIWHEPRAGGGSRLRFTLS